MEPENNRKIPAVAVGTKYVESLCWYMDTDPFFGHLLILKESYDV